MKKENSILKNTKLISFCINAFFFVLAFVTVGFLYEGIDDNDMMMRAFGGSEYVVYQNVILGYLYKFLFGLYKGINWYSLIFYMCSFVSSYVICLCLLDYLENKKVAVISSIVFCAFFTFNIYARMQFTKVAAFLMIAGVTYLFCKKIISGKHTVLSSGFGVILMLLGSMIRYSVIYICIVYACVIALLYFYDFFEADNKAEFVKDRIGLLAIFCVAFALCFGAKIVDKKIIMSDSDYKAYQMVDHARSRVVDKPFNNYDDIKEQLDAIGVSENDYECAKIWFFADPEFFTVSKFNEIAQYSERKTADGLKPFLLSAWDAFFTMVRYPVVNITVLMFLIYILIGYFDKKKILLWLSGFLSVCALYILLIYMLKRVIYRVEFGIWLYLFVFLALSLPQKQELKIKRSIAVLCIIVLVFASSATKLIQEKKHINKRDIAIQKFSEYIKEHSDSVFMVSTNAQASANALSTDLCRGVAENRLSLGETGYMHPYTLKQWDRLGIKNPFRDIVDMDNAYLMSDKGNAELIFQYIREHYYENIEINIVETVGEMSVYKVAKYDN